MYILPVQTRDGRDTATSYLASTFTIIELSALLDAMLAVTLETLVANVDATSYNLNYDSKQALAKLRVG
jgi:hypothetical protein